MKIITNETLIRRNARIGRYAGIAGLVVLAIGAYISFTMQDQVTLAWGALILGFSLAQFGIYYGNRWGRIPRPFELINRELKGLDDSYVLYHYITPASHFLVGPAGAWLFFPFYQRGTITYEKGRWKQKGGGFILAYLKIFAQEGLGRPDLQVQTEMEDMQKYLAKKLPEDVVPPLKGALLFSSEQATIIDVDEAPYATIPMRKLKELIKKEAKSDPLSLVKAKTIQDALELTDK